MPIRKKITYLLFSGIVVGVLLTSLIALNGLRSATEQVTGLNSELGSAAAAESQEAIIERSQIMLAATAHDKAARVDSYFSRIEGNVRLLADAMSDRANAPGSIVPGEVEPPRRENGGKLSTQLFFTSTADRAALAPEIAQTASIGAFLYALNNDNPVICSAYVASASGFAIVNDIYADRAFEDGASAPEPFDFTERPWYQKALAEKKPIFTDVVLDVIGDEYDITCAAPYYRGGAIAGVVGIDALVSDVNKILSDTRLGDTDISFIINERGEVIFSTATEGELVAGNVESPNSALAVLGDFAPAIKAHEETSGEIMLEGDLYHVTLAPLRTTGWYYGIAVSHAELVAPAMLSYSSILQLARGYEGRIMDNMLFILAQVVVGVAVLLCLALVVGRRLAQRTVRPIEELQRGVTRIAGGDLDTRLELNTHDEIEELAQSVNSMTADIKKYMADFRQAVQEKERTSAELGLAASIQQSMLPRIFPPFPDRRDFDIFASMQPARAVGGDFYDFYLVDDSHLMFTIADVSDKGVPAALYMMIAKTIIKNNAFLMQSPDDLAAVMTLVNRQLAENNDEMMFVTSFLAMLDLSTGRLIFVNAGHTPPLLLHDGAVSALAVKKNCVLGIRDNFAYEQQELLLAPGDMLFCYTDGVNEAMNAAGEPFGEDRLVATLASVDAAADTNAILRTVGAAITEFAGGAEQSDDITMLGLKFNQKRGEGDTRGE